MTNRDFAETPVFKKVCGLAKTKATTRQASKFRMGRGLAIPFQAMARTLINQEIINAKI